ncbi:MAG: HEPN domain-containing protein [Candidatus Andersenbacteria bacterium]|nr:HEPN domain-containing protein [Candidatus Andersenbacteria bacterium]
MKPAAASWLKQAAEDLQYARSAFDDGYYSWACFASQQAAEKALKSVIVEKTGAVDKTHRLLALAEHAESFMSGIHELRPQLDVLNQYYSATRYADLHGGVAPYEQFDAETAKEAMDFAGQVLELVQREAS